MVEPLPELPAPDTDVLERDQAPAAEEEPAAKRPCLQPAIDPFPASSDSDDEDLQVLGDSGEVPTRDYPHCRTDCAVHTFERTQLSKKQAVLTNAQHCPQCFCYVCDKPADQCQFWGTGTSPWDHCHAYDDTKLQSQAHWRDLRVIRRNRGADAMAARQAAAMGLPAPAAATAAAAAAGGVAGALRTPGVAKRGRGRPPLRRSTGPSWMMQSSISRFYAPATPAGPGKAAETPARKPPAAAAADDDGGYDEGGTGVHRRLSPIADSSEGSQGHPPQQQGKEKDAGGPGSGDGTPSSARQRRAAAEPPPAAANGRAPGPGEQQQQQQQQRVASPGQRSRCDQRGKAAAAAGAPAAAARAQAAATGAAAAAGEELPPGHGQLGLVRVYCNYAAPKGWVGAAWASTVKMLAGERAFVWQPGSGWIAANVFEEASGKGNCRKWRDTLYLQLPADTAAAGTGATLKQQQPSRSDCVRAGAWLEQHGVPARKRSRGGAH